MERRLKERLIGASVLVMLAVILIPMILDDTSTTETHITQTNIPARPPEGFTSGIVPLPDPAARGNAAQVEARSESATKQAEGDAPAAPAPPAAVSTTPMPAAEGATPKPATTNEPAKKVVAQAVAPAPAKTSVNAQPDRVGLAAWVVQLGSFSSEENANALSQKLRQAGYAAFVEPTGEEGDRAYRVRVGPELLKSDAQALADRLKANMRLDGIVLAYP